MIAAKKEAAKKVDWTEEELQEIISAAKRKEAPLSRGRDSTGYFLEVNGTSIPIDMDKIPPTYQAVFEHLKNNLKPIKF